MRANHNVITESKEEIRSLRLTLKEFEKNYQGNKQYAYCQKSDDEELITGIQFFIEACRLLPYSHRECLTPEELKLAEMEIQSSEMHIQSLEKAKKNLNEAIHLLEKSAQKGSANANIRLGDIFANFCHVKHDLHFLKNIQAPDEEKAIPYYLRAAQAGYEDSLITLQSIFFRQNKFTLAVCITRSLIQANPENWEHWIGSIEGVFRRHKLKNNPRVCYYLTTALFYVEKKAASLEKAALTELTEDLAFYKEILLPGYDKFQLSQLEEFNEEVILNQDEALIEFITKTRNGISKYEDESKFSGEIASASEMNNFGNKLPSGPIRFFYYHRDFSITPELVVEPIIFLSKY